MFRSQIDSSIKFVLQIVAACTLLIVGLIVAFLLTESWPAIQQLGWRMYTDRSWFPAEFAEEGTYGLFPIVVGTFLVSSGSILIAAPMGVVSAIYSRYYAPAKIAFFYRRLIELLAGIPSVVFGFWGLVVLAPNIARAAEFLGAGQVPGSSLLAAILIVALMILPTVMLVAESALMSVRQEYLSGAAALGMGRLTIIRKIILPQAKAGIITGIVLAIARAIGETMAVVMVAGNIVKLPDSVLAPVRTLTANIALEMGYAVGMQRSALFFSGLLLLASVAVLFAFEVLMRRVIWRTV